MTRSTETLWWLSVCVVIALLAGLIGYRMKETATTVAQPQPIETAVTVTRSAGEQAMGRAAAALRREPEQSAEDLRKQLLSAAAQHPGNEFNLIGYSVARYARVEPLQALELVQASADLHRYLGWVFYGWSQNDLPSAKAALNSLRPGDQQLAGRHILMAEAHLPLDSYVLLSEEIGAVDQALRFWSDYHLADDPQGAWADVQRIEKESPDQRYAQQFVERWMTIDAHAALTAYHTLDRVYPEQVSQLLVSAEGAALTPTLAWTERYYYPALHGARRTLIKRLAIHDPEAALEFVGRITDTDAQANRRLVLSLWSNVQPDKAADWALRNGYTEDLPGS